jgi:hypothetical protein
MIINKQGEAFEYEGKKYIVGEDVYATESNYYGLIGVIKEIRTGEDKETDNPEPDIYCDFFEPVLEADKERLYQTFGNYYALDGIIMAPSMVTPIREGCCNGKEKFGTLFLLQEEWAYDGDGVQTNTMAFTNKESALMFFKYRLYQESEDGSISSYRDNDAVVVDEGAEDYEIFLEGFYNDDHYIIHILELPLAMSESYLKSLAGKVIAVERREHLIEQIEQWEETSEMSDAQYSAVINDETLSERIGKKLADDEFYWDSYWQAVSEVASDLIAKHTKKE